jgi:hypothetical protein
MPLPGRGPPATLPKEPKEESDTVGEEFGREFSDGTLDMLRGIRRPEWQEDDESLDPVEDMQDYLDNGLAMPPTTYDALQAAAQEDLERLQSLREQQPDPEQAAIVRYRQRLAEGASHKDLTWLKLRAYHRAMSELRADQEQQRSEAHAQRLQAYQVPTDRIPAELLDLTPEQLAERRKLAAMASSKRSRSSRSKSEAAPTTTQQPAEQQQQEASSSAPAQTGPRRNPYLPSPQVIAAGVAAAFQELHGKDGGGGAASQSSQGSQSTTDAAGQAASSSRADTDRPKPRTVYTAEYLEEMRLQKEIASQQRQRSLAFWLSLSCVVGGWMAYWCLSWDCWCSCDRLTHHPFVLM